MDITITFPDGKKSAFAKGSTAIDVAMSISEGLARSVCAAKFNDVLIDATRPLEEDGSLELLKFESDAGREVFWHSSAHLLAQAVLRVFPEAKPTIGPVIEEGFYYDFDHAPFSPEDLVKIESEMKSIVKEKLETKRVEYSQEEALKQFKENKYKCEIIKEAEGDITAYEQGDFIDLCRGPHLPNTGMIKSFKLTKISAAYWRGDAKSASLQRIYGVSYPDKKLLKEYLVRMEEAAKRDHKKIGRDQELFMIHEMVGKGLPLWLPKGEVIKNAVEKYAEEMESEAGYVRVSTPHLAKEELFLASGHLPHYEDSMYPKMVMDDGTYFLKAMNCPFHHVIFGHEARSHKELPLRMAEYGTVYRNELSGALSGLLRVRMLSMNDAHIYCTKEQIGDEIKAVLKMITEYYKVFGFDDYYFRLSLWSPKNKEKYIDEPKNWDYAEEELRKVLKELGVKYEEVVDEAAFYGPKIDIQFKTVLGREESMSTVQLDFAAKSRFNLAYTDSNNNKNKEVFVIHRAPLSTHERFMAFLIEHYGGKWPLWLNPVQVSILTLADRHLKYAEQIAEEMKALGLRVEIDSESNTIPKKVRNAQLAQINYILVVGDNEEKNGTVNVRTRDNQVHGEKKVNIFVQELVDEVKSRRR